MIIQHFDPAGALGSRQLASPQVHIGEGDGLDRTQGEAAGIIAGQHQARHQAEIAAAVESSHILHARMEQVAHAEQDISMANPLDACRDMGMVADHQIDAVGDHEF